MKRCIKLGLLFAVMMCLALTVACTKKQPAPVEPTVAPVTAQDDTISEQELERQRQAQRAEAAKAEFLNAKVYFAFDDASLSEQARETLNAQANWLQENSGATVVIEGHADSRGTDEYNLALGSRRAESVKNFLNNLGIDSSRLITISYGEERPAVPGENDDAWTQNRRVEFRIQ